MKDEKITPKILLDFENYLLVEEKSEVTIEKYIRDVRTFYEFIGKCSLSKELTISYKQMLTKKNYAIASVNSMLAAVNRFLEFVGRADCKVKTIRVQRKAYCSEEKELTKEEYLRLLQVANRKNNKRLSLLIQTICATGIRVSELQYITVEAVRKGEANVLCKAKTRRVFLVKQLQSKLCRYIKEQHITAGPIFVTRTGTPMSRTNIWREMKDLCAEAGVNPKKVFPHNLRCLFARIFYAIEKDIAKLADILGHSSINTTRIYIMTTGSEHRRKMELMRLIT